MTFKISLEQLRLTWRPICCRFVGFELSTTKEVLGILVYFLVVCAIFVQSDLAAINPTVCVVGFRIVRARFKSRGETDPIVVVLIPRTSDLPCDQPASVVRFGHFFSLRVRKATMVNTSETAILESDPRFIVGYWQASRV